MGIDIQALTPAPNQTYYDTPPDLGIATARVINDNIADIVARHPNRFVGLGTVPFQAPEPAVAELERLHRSLGLRGIEIATNVAGEDLLADRFRRIFAKAEELGLSAEERAAILGLNAALLQSVPSSWPGLTRPSCVREPVLSVR